MALTFLDHNLWGSSAPRVGGLVCRPSEGLCTVTHLSAVRVMRVGGAISGGDGWTRFD